jgi:hypothetical protein
MLALNLYLLCKYRTVFNGRKVIFAADVSGLVDMEHLGWMFNDTHSIVPYELVPVPGGGPNPSPEVVGRMLKSVESKNPDEVTFFAFAKGTYEGLNREHSVSSLSTWVEPMYHANLGDGKNLSDMLASHPCVGSYRYPCNDYHKEWRYYGSFFWYRHVDMYVEGWEDSLGRHHGVDGYISDKFQYDVAGSLVGKDYLESALMQPCEPFDVSKVSVITTSMNRWEFLSQSLPTWLGKGFKEIIVVDWSSETDVSFPMMLMPVGDTPVRVVRVEGEEIFNAGMARNTGAKRATGDYLLFLDSDMKITDWSHASSMPMEPNRFYHGPHNIPPFGTSLVRTEDFIAVNGYSELYEGYGWEDNDLYNRLEANGVKRCFFDERMVKHIDHDDELRTRHRRQGGKKLHETIWSNRDNVERWTISHTQARKECEEREFFL